MSGNLPDAANAVSHGAKVAAQQAIAAIKHKAPALLRRNARASARTR